MDNVGPLPNEAATETLTETLLRGICDRLDRVWESEHNREISTEIARLALVEANATIEQYAQELTDMGLTELARRVWELVE